MRSLGLLLLGALVLMCTEILCLRALVVPHSLSRNNVQSLVSVNSHLSSFKSISSTSMHVTTFPTRDYDREKRNRPTAKIQEILHNFKHLLKRKLNMLKIMQKIKKPIFSLMIIMSLLSPIMKSSHAKTLTDSVVGNQQLARISNKLSERTQGSVVASASKVETKKPPSFSALQQVGMDREVVQEVERSWNKLTLSLQGVKLDSIIMLVATSAVIPLFKMLNISPIVGFLLTGTLIGPGGLNLVRDIHLVDMLGEMGIVFFLFEMGLELSFDRLKAMRRDVFGLGSSQFLLTSAAIAWGARLCGLPTSAAVTIGGSLALSSSAFVLQLLKDQNAMASKHGKASFGILLLQDLAVVPLLVIVELLGEGGAGLGRALGIAGAKAVVTLSALSVLGKRFLNPLFSLVARSRSQEAFLSIILSTVFIMSFVTQGIGLSDTLGAFLAGILLSETSYRYQIEADISVFRGFLLGLFFMTVGFKLDSSLLVREAKTIALMLLGMLGTKAAVITLLGVLFGLPLASAQWCGLLNAQAGEFAFVSLGIAERMGLLPAKLTKLLLTTVALSMALTPLLAEAGAALSRTIENKLGAQHSTLAKPKTLDEVQRDIDVQNVVIICGFGRVGRLIAEMLDRKFIPYIALDNSPQRVLEARNQGLPVYYGDVNRPEMLKHFHLEEAKACVITFDGISTINKSVIRLRKLFPSLRIIARATNPQHQQRLETMFDNLQAVNPVIPEDSQLLLLPFGGAVLSSVGVPESEVDAVLEDVRQRCLADDDDDRDADGSRATRSQALLKFVDMFRRPSTEPAAVSNKESGASAAAANSNPTDNAESASDVE